MKDFVRDNITFCAIIIFLTIYVLIIQMRPSMIFYKDGTLKEFGVGYRNKTIIPIWLAAIILAILSYIIIMYIAYLY
jgi:hypothetical protein